MSKFHGFTDNFHRMQSGSYTNFPQLIQEDTTIREEFLEDNNLVVILMDGRKYSRPTHYADISPYGWKFCSFNC